MASHALCMIDNDGGFSVICEILSHQLTEWEKLAEFIETRIKDVASQKAELSAYAVWYQSHIDGSDYLYKYGDYPGIYVMQKIDTHTYEYDGENYESDYVWGSEEILEFCTQRYDGGQWTLALDKVPDLLPNARR